MKTLYVLIGLLLAGVLWPGVTDGRTFTQDEVIAIFQAGARRMGKPGVLSKEIDKTPHRNFKMYWDTHLLTYTMESCHLTLVKAQSAAYTFTGYVIYYFFDFDFDGKVDYCARYYFVIMDDGTIVSFPGEMPDESLKELYFNWAMNVPNAQELYEQELEFWYNELKEEING